MGCWLLLIEPEHLGSNSILKVRFLGDPVQWHLTIYFYFAHFVELGIEVSLKKIDNQKLGTCLYHHVKL